MITTDDKAIEEDANGNLRIVNIEDCPYGCADENKMCGSESYCAADEDNILLIVLCSVAAVIIACILFCCCCKDSKKVDSYSTH